MSTNTHTQSEENAHPREERISKSEVEQLLDKFTDHTERWAKKMDAPVNIEIDERGANPRFTITILVNADEEIEAGIKKLRRYP